jgi:hypothetical protein
MAIEWFCDRQEIGEGLARVASTERCTAGGIAQVFTYFAIELVA